MNDCSDTPSREVLQGEKAANRRYQWYEQIIADGCRHLVGAAHEIARSGFQIGIDELARRICASEATARRERDELIKRGHLIKFSGRGRRGKEACNRYGMVLKVADLQFWHPGAGIRFDSGFSVSPRISLGASRAR